MYLFAFVFVLFRISRRQDNKDLKAANIPAASRQSGAFLSLHGAASLEDKTRDMKVKASERVGVGAVVVCVCDGESGCGGGGWTVTDWDKEAQRRRRRGSKCQIH